MGWLPIVNYTGEGGWLVNNGGCLQYYTILHKRTSEGGG